MQISIRNNFPSVQKKLDQLQKDVGARALASAVNRTIEQGRTQMIREITSEYAVKAGYVRQRLTIRRANFKAGVFRIEATLTGGGKYGKGRSANVIAFDARRTSRGVSVKIKKTGGRKVITGAFIGNKGRTVFKRIGKDRLPIKAVQTVGVPQMFNQKRINAAVVAAIKARFPAIFEREAKFYVDKFNVGF
jgi:hypothetical protein